MGIPAFKDTRGIHDKDGVGTTRKGHEEAREMRGLKIMEDSRQAPEKKYVSYHQGSLSLVFTNKAPITNRREMLLC